MRKAAVSETSKPYQCVCKVRHEMLSKDDRADFARVACIICVRYSTRRTDRRSDKGYTIQWQARRSLLSVSHVFLTMRTDPPVDGLIGVLQVRQPKLRA